MAASAMPAAASAMPAAKRMRFEGSDEGQSRDLKLLCADGASMLVSAQLLKDASRSVAIKDVIGKLQQEHPGASNDAPMEFSVSEDEADVWKVVWELVLDPMTEKPTGLSWWNLEKVITLADKYALLAATQACDTFVGFKVPAEVCVKLCEHLYLGYWGTSKELLAYHERNKEMAKFGYLVVDWVEHEHEDRPMGFPLDLSLLEALHRAQCCRAVTRLLPAYVQLLGTAVKDKKGVGEMVREITEAVPASSPVYGLIAKHMLLVLEGVA